MTSRRASRSVASGARVLRHGAQLGLVLGLAVCAAVAGGAADQDHASTLPEAAAGARLYLDGIGSDGAVITGRFSQGALLSGASAACVSCHRRSGFGTAEGYTVVAPIIGPRLYRPVQLGRAEQGRIRTTGPGTRPAYSDETLAVAIRDGRDPAGRTLGTAMPRYALGVRDMANVIAYLRQLGATPPPGVTADTIHLATIVADDAAPAKVEAMNRVLTTYVRERGANTRNETARRERAPWDMAQEYSAYRSWTLHTWRLSGERASWPGQLQRAYARQPVFAVVSGIASGSWRPIHDFCEAERIPCLFPNTDEPGTPEGHYTIYLGRGLTLEGLVAGRHLLETMPPGAEVIQVFRDTTAGLDAASALRRAAAGAGRLTVRDVRIGGDADAVERLRGVAKAPAAVLLWLDARGLDAVAPAVEAWPSARLVVSSTLLDVSLDQVPVAWRHRTSVVHPYEAPARLARTLARTDAWLTARGITSPERRVLANTFFAVTQTGEMTMRMRANFSREYFVEQMEHMTGSAGVTAFFPRLSLGPGRRYASTGAYILEFPSDGGPPRPATAWIVPDA